MKRNVFIMGVVLILLASACAPRATPTANPVDIQHTAEAAAFTMVAATQQALPSATSAPPTNTPSPTVTAAPTNTAPPLPGFGTQQATPTSLAQPGVALPTALPTMTTQAQVPQPAAGSVSTETICNQPLTAWQGPTANFQIVNQTKPEGTIILSMYVVTKFGQCGYLVVTGNSFSGPIGDYSAGAFITGKQNFKAFGAFRITEGNWKVVVRNDSITAQGGCSPNC